MKVELNIEGLLKEKDIRLRKLRKSHIEKKRISELPTIMEYKRMQNNKRNGNNFI